MCVCVCVCVHFDLQWLFSSQGLQIMKHIQNKEINSAMLPCQEYILPMSFGYLAFEESPAAVTVCKYFAGCVERFCARYPEFSHLDLVDLSDSNRSFQRLLASVHNVGGKVSSASSSSLLLWFSLLTVFFSSFLCSCVFFLTSQIAPLCLYCPININIWIS